MKFDNMTENEAREQILGMVKEYCDTYHNKKGPFKEGDRIPYASRVYDHSEMVNLVDSALEFWLTSVSYTHLRMDLHTRYCKGGISSGDKRTVKDQDRFLQDGEEI